jgi:hypothetical protein
MDVRTLAFFTAGNRTMALTRAKFDPPAKLIFWAVNLYGPDRLGVPTATNKIYQTYEAAVNDFTASMREFTIEQEFAAQAATKEQDNG